MHAVPGTASGSRQEGLAIVLDDAGDVARYLRILALAADHPEFPPELRELVCAAAVEMTRWQARLAEVLEPVDDRHHRAGAASPVCRADGSSHTEMRRRGGARERLRISA
jgi:hypothetical protein